MDARVKPAHDESMIASTSISYPRLPGARCTNSPVPRRAFSANIAQAIRGRAHGCIAPRHRSGAMRILHTADWQIGKPFRRFADKAEALRKVLEGPPGELPAQRIRPVDGSLSWFLDEAAARKLSSFSRGEP